MTIYVFKDFLSGGIACFSSAEKRKEFFKKANADIIDKTGSAYDSDDYRMVEETLDPDFDEWWN